MQEYLYHIPALLEEVKEYLKPKLGSKIIDCTAGGGGHFVALAESAGSEGRVLGIDLDPDAMSEIQRKIESRGLANRVVLKIGNFKDIEKIAKNTDFAEVDGILFDLGVSSFQLDEKKKGFGFLAETLDMRMGTETKLTAADIINTWDESSLAEIFQTYGEEPLANKISIEIIKKRREKKFFSSKDLSALIGNIYKNTYRTQSRRNPATRVFQALRIAVNDEIQNLILGIRGGVNILKKGGRIACISYHSLEDRIVKQFFKTESRDCVCPSVMPVCQCQHKATLKIITKKLVVPKQIEIKTNPRSRSARLRVAEKI